MLDLQQAVLDMKHAKLAATQDQEAPLQVQVSVGFNKFRCYLTFVHVLLPVCATSSSSEVSPAPTPGPEDCPYCEKGTASVTTVGTP